MIVVVARSSGMRAISVYCLVSVVGLAVVLPSSRLMAQSNKAAPVHVETCVLNIGDAASRDRLSKPRPKMPPAEVLKQCSNILGQMRKAEEPELIARQGRSNLRSLVHGWLHPVRAYPELLRRGIAEALNDRVESAYSDFTTAIEILRSTGGLGSDALPRDPKLRADLVWILLARASLLDAGKVRARPQFDVDLALKLSPSGPDNQAPNGTAFSALRLDPKTIKQQIDDKSSKGDADKVKGHEAYAQRYLERRDYSSARQHYELALQLSRQHAKRAELFTLVSFTYCGELRASPHDAQLRPLREKTLDAAKQAITEALSAQRDPAESEAFGSQIGELISQALLLRARCRVARTSIVNSVDVRDSIAEAEKAIEMSMPLGDARKSVDELLMSLKKLQAETARR